MIYTVTLNPAVDKELTVPAIELDTVLRATAVRIDAGGKGFNVSRMLNSLGMANTAVALAGGSSGRFLRHSLEALGITTDFVGVDGETRTNISVVNEKGGHYLKVNEPGPAVGDAPLEELLNRVRVLAVPGDWWVLSGSLPPGVPPATYGRIIEIVQNAGGRAILDSSGEALRLGCRARPYLVKPNALEAAELVAGQAGAEVDEPDPGSSADLIRALGPRNVLISLGKEGALLATTQGSWQAGSPAVREANPTGAGDSMVAGVIYGLEQGMAWPGALQWGVVCGAAAASMPGTGSGSRNLVEELLTNY